MSQRTNNAYDKVGGNLVPSSSNYEFILAGLYLTDSEDEEENHSSKDQMKLVRRLEKYQRREDAKLPFEPAKSIIASDGTRLTLFFTKAYCFSNHFSRKGLLRVDGLEYSCVEQFYMAYKATVFGDKKATAAIMDSDDPGEIKRIGSHIKNFDDVKWRRIAVMVMMIATLRKYQQNADLREQLIQTGSSVIGEANPRDTFWGVGLGMKNPWIVDAEFWQGRNVLGELLMFVRAKVKKDN